MQAVPRAHNFFLAGVEIGEAVEVLNLLLRRGTKCDLEAHREIQAGVMCRPELWRHLLACIHQ